jgi:hypothetical protein
MGESASHINNCWEVPLVAWILSGTLVIMVREPVGGKVLTLRSPPPLQFTDIVVSVSFHTLLFPTSKPVEALMFVSGTAIEH